MGQIQRRGPARPRNPWQIAFDRETGRLWALDIADTTGRKINRKIPWSGLPIFGFGTDADGEAYVLTSSPTGQGVFRLAPAAPANASSAVTPTK